MRKNLFFLTFAIAIFSVTTAFVLIDDSEVSDAPVDYMTLQGLGLNLDAAIGVVIQDDALFYSEVDRMISDAGYDLQIKEITATDAITNGEVTSKTFLVHYVDDSDAHTVTISYNSSASLAGPKIVPICVNLGCTAGCNPMISPAGKFSCTACTGPWYATCFIGYVPAI